MLIAFKALGATFVAGALAVSGVVTGDQLIGMKQRTATPAPP